MIYPDTTSFRAEILRARNVAVRLGENSSPGEDSMGSLQPDRGLPTGSVDLLYSVGSTAVRGHNSHAKSVIRVRPIPVPRLGAHGNRPSLGGHEARPVRPAAEENLPSIGVNPEFRIIFLYKLRLIYRPIPPTVSVSCQHSLGGWLPTGYQYGQRDIVSCPHLDGLQRVQIRPQFMPRHAGDSFDGDYAQWRNLFPLRNCLQ